MTKILDNKTKIIATLGPSTSSSEIIKEMIEVGVDGFRFNFSHGDYKKFSELVKIVRNESKKLKKDIPILGDLQGPKIRVGKIVNGEVELKKGNLIKIFDEDIIGNANEISTSYPKLTKEVKVGERVFIDDGLIKLRIIEKKKNHILCKIIEGGVLKERKGLNIPDSVLTTPSLTKTDLDWLNFAIQYNFDFLALSFVRNDLDVIQLREFLRKKRVKIPIISKIELKLGIKNFESILKVSDGIMVARGDLGVELGPEEVPPLQKKIIKRCIEARKLVITATQMLESMIHNPIPTRAEASDVANVVLDGTDAVLLTAETSIGKDPVRVVKTMFRLLRRAEEIKATYNLKYDYIEEDEAHIQSIARAAVQIANDINSKIILPVTYSGFTAIVLSKYLPDAKIMAITNQKSTVNLLSLYRNVYPLYFSDISDIDKIIKMTSHLLISQKIIKKNDLIVFVGSLKTKSKTISNLIKVVQT